MLYRLDEDDIEYLIRIIYPFRKNFLERYSNKGFIRKGSRYIKYYVCPFCTFYYDPLTKECYGCPIDEYFGIENPKTGKSIEGCKVVLNSLFGPLTFKDFASAIVTKVYPNPQITKINKWLIKNLFGK